MELTIFDNKVYDLVDPDAPLEKLDSGFVFVEGPVFLNGTYYFTDFTVNKIYTWKNGVTTLINDNSKFSIGMFYDRKRDRILRCTRELRAITDMDGNVIVGHYKGVPINGSNDVITDNAGRIYFTDPLSRKIEGVQIGHSSVFMYDEATGEMVMLENTLTYPNGLALSPDEGTLYIADTNAISVYKIDMQTKELGLLAKLDESMGSGRPDGMRVDTLGNLYVTGPGGIWLLAPDGKALGLIKMPEVAANLCFDGHGLFITASTSIYRVATKIPPAVPVLCVS